jgi:hypothetical protein
MSLVLVSRGGWQKGSKRSATAYPELSPAEVVLATPPAD